MGRMLKRRSPWTQHGLLAPWRATLSEYTLESLTFPIQPMDLSKIDEMIANRSKRIDKRKEDGTLFEEEFKKPEESEDERLAREVEEQKKKDEERLKERLPACPQCGKKMTLVPEQGLIACHDCGVGMRI